MEYNSGKTEIAKPLTYNISGAWVWFAVAVIFFISILVCIKREMDILFVLFFSIFTTGIAATCWFSARYYLKNIPYAFFSAPVLLSVFWPFYAVFLPLGYVFGGTTFMMMVPSPEIYIKAQMWTFFGTLTFCYGLSIFSKKLAKANIVPPSQTAVNNLKTGWFFVLVISSFKWIQFFSQNLFSRFSVYQAEQSPFSWVTDQLGFCAIFASLLIPAFIFVNLQEGTARKVFWKIYIFLALPMMFLLITISSYRFFIVSLLSIFISYCAYSKKIARNVILAISFVLLLAPLFITLRSGGTMEEIGQEGSIEQVLDTTKKAAQVTYLESKNVEKKNEWERCGDTFRFTADTMEEIPQYEDYFYGDLFLQDFKFLVPNMLWANKFGEEMLDSEAMIELRVRGFHVDTGFGPIVHLWASGGPLVVLLGMFIFGLIYGYIYFICILKSKNGLSILLYSFLIFYITNLETNWVVSLFGNLRFFPLLIAGWYLMGAFGLIKLKK